MISPLSCPKYVFQTLESCRTCPSGALSRRKPTGWSPWVEELSDSQDRSERGDAQRGSLPLAGQRCPVFSRQALDFQCAEFFDARGQGIDCPPLPSSADAQTEGHRPFPGEGRAIEILDPGEMPAGISRRR